MRPTKASLWEGVRQIKVSPFLRSLTAHAALYNASAQILVVNLVILAVKERGLSAGGYGLALSAGGAGAFVGAMLGLRLADRLGYGRAFGASLVLSTGLPLLLALLPGRGLQFGVLLEPCSSAPGIGLGSANVLSVTIRQLLIPRSTLARSNGAYRTFTFGVLPIGAALGRRTRRHLRHHRRSRRRERRHRVVGAAHVRPRSPDRSQTPVTTAA